MSERVRVHMRVPGTAPMPQLMRLIQDIEAAGFEGAGILDSQVISRDSFVTLGQAAAHTSRLTLFPETPLRSAWSARARSPRGDLDRALSPDP